MKQRWWMVAFPYFVSWLGAMIGGFFGLKLMGF